MQIAFKFIFIINEYLSFNKKKNVMQVHKVSVILLIFNYFLKNHYELDIQHCILFDYKIKWKILSPLIIIYQKYKIMIITNLKKCSHCDQTK